MYGILPARTYMHTTCLPGAMDLLEQELQAVVSCHRWCWELNLGLLSALNC